MALGGFRRAIINKTDRSEQAQFLFSAALSRVAHRQILTHPAQFQTGPFSGIPEKRSFVESNQKTDRHDGENWRNTDHSKTEAKASSSASSHGLGPSGDCPSSSLGVLVVAELEMLKSDTESLGRMGSVE